jgi:glycosyltransferase involved in cell wall biosynthesis
MKVAFYNHTSAVSGAEISLLLTAKHLTKAEPILFAPEGELLTLAREAALKVVPIPGYRARLSRNPLRLLKDSIGMLGAGFKFAQMVRRHRADLIHANSLRAGIMAAMFVWLHRRPLIWHVRDIPPDGIIGKGIGVLAASSAKAVIGISNSVLQKFTRQKLVDKMHLVHNGVEIREISVFERRLLRKKIREELHASSSSKVIAIIGQISPWKRQEDALLAAKELLNRGHDIVLWIVGEAKFREEDKVYLKTLIAMMKRMELMDRVRFTGFRTDVMEICCAADLLYLCSDNEPFGRVIIEAMSQAVPVVATNAGGVPEIIEHESTGLLYEVADVEGLVQCADHLLRNDDARKEMGRLAARRVRECFTIQDTVAKIEEIYSNIVIEREFS